MEKINVNMKRQIIRAFLTFLTGKFVVVLLIFAANVNCEAQNTNQNAEVRHVDERCVKVSITADSVRLKKSRPIQLKVSAENLCKRTIEIREPTFTIDKSPLRENLMFGDRRSGRIIRNSKIDNAIKSIEPGKVLDFALDTGEIRWVDSMSSIEVLTDLFTDHHLKTGSYDLYCTILVEPILDQSKKVNGREIVRIVSNKIVLLFDGR